jgi:hypothetical protein
MMDIQELEYLICSSVLLLFYWIPALECISTSNTAKASLNPLRRPNVFLWKHSFSQAYIECIPLIEFEFALKKNIIILILIKYIKLVSNLNYSIFKLKRIEARHPGMILQISFQYEVCMYVRST